MLRLTILAILFAAVCAVPINHESEYAVLDETFLESIDDNLADISKTDVSRHHHLQRFRYTWGQRVAGDILVQEHALSNSRPTRFNIAAALSHVPTNLTITFAQIIVEQDSNGTWAGIQSGGIGQQRLVVGLNARRITYYSLIAEFFGR